MRIFASAIFTLAAFVTSNLTQVAVSLPELAAPEPEANSRKPEGENTLILPFCLSEPDASCQNQAVQYYQDYQLDSRENKSVNLPASDDELVVIATDIKIVGAGEELQEIIRNVIQTVVGGETSKQQLKKDAQAILNTGLFTKAQVFSQTNPKGLDVEYRVKPLVVRSLQLSQAKVLTLDVADNFFRSQLGATISPTALNQSVEQINQWYTENGYVLARVLSIRPNQQGILTLEVAEGAINRVKFRFLNENGASVDAQGKPVTSRTQPDFLQQQLKIKPGQIFQKQLVQQDLQQLYQLGIFQYANIALEGDAKKVDVIYILKESPTRGINFGGGYNQDMGLFGSANYLDQNVAGINDTFGLNIKANPEDLQFEASFTSAYRASEPDTLGYRLDVFRRRGISQTFDGDIKLPNDDSVREGQFGGRISLQRPIANWQASLGLNYTRTSIRDQSGNLASTDELGNQLSFSGTGIDDLTTISLTAAKDERNNPLNPTQGSILSLSTEQSIPIGLGSIAMNRLQANYSQFFPVQILRTENPEVFAVNLQAGTTIGDLPPYEAFNLGGINSVRGYGLGDVGNGRSYVLASAEYRFPILNLMGGVFFADFASDLGTGDTILGEPGEVRGKPGSGFGYGAGVRFDSPIGIMRADFGINDDGESRLQFGFGHRF